MIQIICGCEIPEEYMNKTTAIITSTEWEGEKQESSETLWCSKCNLPINEIAESPVWDCTDAAHPAWWRAEKHSYNKFCEIVLKWLDNPDLKESNHQHKLKNVLTKIDELKEENKRLKGLVKVLQNYRKMRNFT